MGSSLSKSFAAMLVLIFLTASCLIVLLPVTAESQTIVVPDDYLTISSAIGNATAGNTVFVKKGTYEGPIDQTLVIDKALSLVGEDTNNTILILHPAYTEWWILTQPYISYSNAISVDANDFKLSGFSISTQGSIAIKGDRTQITGNKIATGISVTGSNCNITGNAIDGVIILEGSSNVLNQNSVSGIALKYAYSNTITNNTFAYLNFGSVSDTNYTCSYNIISRNRIEGDWNWGIWLGAGSHNVFYENHIANYRGYDGWGVALGFGTNGTHNSLVGTNNTFYHNIFTNNNKNVYDSWNNLTAPNFWDNDEEGNYWDDYNGTDDNRDGIGDTPYVINGDNIDYYPLMEPFDVESDAVVLPSPESFPATLVVVVPGVSVVVIGVALLVYFKKHHPKLELKRWGKALFWYLF
jgi:parallel beta-helix repeat protein